MLARFPHPTRSRRRPERQERQRSRSVRKTAADLFHAVDGRFLNNCLYLYLKAASLRRKKEAPPTPTRILELSRSPILIGGCGRSGTTLALSILSSHPHIFAIPEETRAFCPPARTGSVVSRGSLQPRRIFHRLLHSEIPANCHRWCEKTPGNVHFIDRILELFGEPCRFIHMVRDGRDVITSRHPNDPGAYWVSKERWLADVQAGLKFRQHPQVLTLRYEDLVGDYERAVDRICSFLGEPFHSAMLEYPKTATIKANTAWFGTAEAVHDRSIKRWRRPEHREVVEAMMTDEVAVDLLAELGYLETTLGDSST